MITKQQIEDLEADLNDILQEERAKMRLTVHFAVDRVNDPRNSPAIALAELRTIFTTFIDRHLKEILLENEGFKFTIRCGQSNICIPCIIEHQYDIGAKWVVQQVMTVMRNPNFKAYHGDKVFDI